MFIVFIIYELNEDWHISDSAFIDILFYAIGLYTAAVILILVRWLWCGSTGYLGELSVVRLNLYPYTISTSANMLHGKLLHGLLPGRYCLAR